MLVAMALGSLALAAPGLRLDPSHPPVKVGEQAGLPLYRYAPGVEWPTRPAVVLTLAPDADPPTGAIPLGGPSWLLPSTDAVATALAWADDPRVVSAFPDVLLPQAPRGFDGFDDEHYGGQWYLEQLEMETLYAVSLGDAATRVAVIDSGIDISHEDLIDGIDAPYDAWADDDDPSPDPGEYCSAGDESICDEHGTAVSGVVAARANNGVGIVGMCPECTLVPIKLLGESGGSGTAMSADVRAFEHAIEQDVAVINNSWGFTEPTPVPGPLAEVIERAATEGRDGKGALVVFAAGNDDRELGDDEMEALPEVLCVSAMDSYGLPTGYTNTGAAIDVAAPSATVTLAPEDGWTETFGGTSAAAPVVSGLAAWAAAQDPDLTAADLMDLIVSTAEPSPNLPVDENGWNDTYGWGRISPVAVMEALYPPAEEAEDPVACGCSTGSMAPAWLGLAALALIRRRA